MNSIGLGGLKQHCQIVSKCLHSYLIIIVYRVVTHLENLEKSGNSKVVMENEKSGETEMLFVIHATTTTANQFINGRKKDKITQLNKK